MGQTVTVKGKQVSQADWVQGWLRTMWQHLDDYGNPKLLNLSRAKDAAYCIGTLQCYLKFVRIQGMQKQVTISLKDKRRRTYSVQYAELYFLHLNIMKWVTLARSVHAYATKKREGYTDAQELIKKKTGVIVKKLTAG